MHGERRRDLRNENVALVTGSTSGIGRAIANQLARDGFQVVVTGRSSERGREVEAEIGAAATFVSCDLLEVGAPEALVENVLSLKGRMDVVVNNAAVDHTNDLLEVGVSEIRGVLESNTVAPMAILIAAARAMKAQGSGGSIINITSRLASVGVPTMSVYSASKGAILAFTTAAAVELAPHNIRVNSIAPGMTRTPLFDEWLSGFENSQEIQDKVVAAIPLGRLATPEDVASAVSFLASPGAAYITGASIPVEGGYLSA